MSNLPDLQTIHDELDSVVSHIESALLDNNFQLAIQLSRSAKQLRKQRSMVKMLQAKHATQFFNEWDEELVSIEEMQELQKQWLGE
jgi:hypothetical protein